MENKCIIYVIPVHVRVELLAVQLVVGGSLRGETLFPCSVLYVLLHLLEGHRPDADQRVLEVRAHLTWSLTMTSLQLTAQALPDVTFTAHAAVFTVLFLVGERRLAGASVCGVCAKKSRLAVAVPAAKLTLLQSVREQARAHDAAHVDADGSGAAVLVGGALLPVARILVLLKFLVHVSRALEPL